MHKRNSGRRSGLAGDQLAPIGRRAENRWRHGLGAPVQCRRRSRSGRRAHGRSCLPLPREPISHVGQHRTTPCPMARRPIPMATDAEGRRATCMAVRPSFLRAFRPALGSMAGAGKGVPVRERLAASSSPLGARPLPLPCRKPNAALISAPTTAPRRHEWAAVGTATRSPARPCERAVQRRRRETPAASRQSSAYRAVGSSPSRTYPPRGRCLRPWSGTAPVRAVTQAAARGPPPLLGEAAHAASQAHLSPRAYEVEVRQSMGYILGIRRRSPFMHRGRCNADQGLTKKCPMPRG